VSTKERTLRTFAVDSRWKRITLSPPSKEIPPTILNHDAPRSTDSPAVDFQDPYEQLPMPAPEDRVRAILGLCRGASLPKINAATLFRYYRYLSSRLTLPCEARYSSDSDDTVYPVTVIRLVDPQTMRCDNRAGLSCIVYQRNKADALPLVDIEVGHDCPNFQILEDYWFWVWNWRESRSCCPSKPR
jgi:hypothetical protein